MSFIPIADSVRLARKRLQSVLEAFLPQKLNELSAQFPDHRLVPPERYVRARPVESRMREIWRRANINEVACFIYRHGPARPLAEYSGDGQVTTKTALLPFRVAIFVRWGGAFEPAEPGELEDEWQADRIELYRGAVTDILTQHARDNDAIKEVSIAAFDSDVTDSFHKDIGIMSFAMIAIEAFQDTQTKR